RAIKGNSNNEQVETDDNLEDKIIKLVQIKQIENEFAEMYMYRFDTCAEQVMPLSFALFEAAKVVAEIMKKHLLEIENNEKMIKIMNDEEMNIFDKGDIDNIDHEVKIVEHEIEMKSELEKVKMGKVENSSNGLMDWLTIIGDGYLEKYDDENTLIGNNEHYANMGRFTTNNLENYKMDNHGLSYLCHHSWIWDHCMNISMKLQG
ncbi:38451_t:CDS:2, partial [Gigaspora margarita]